MPDYNPVTHCPQDAKPDSRPTPPEQNHRPRAALRQLQSREPELPLKVAVSGSHGTGKTTLLDALQRHNPTNVQVLPETPRLLIELAGDSTYLRREKNTLINEIAIIPRQMALETRISVDTDLIICDRTVADDWAYTSLLFPDELRSPAVMLTARTVRDWLKSYDRIFLLRPELPLVDDGTREDSSAFQSEVDAFLDRYYAEAGVPVISLAGSLEERSNTFLNEVSM